MEMETIYFYYNIVKPKNMFTVFIPNISLVELNKEKIKYMKRPCIITKFIMATLGVNYQMGVEILYDVYTLPILGLFTLSMLRWPMYTANYITPK